MSSTKRRRNIYLDPDTHDFMEHEYNSSEVSELMNHLIRNFMQPYRDANLRKLFEEAAEKTVSQLQEDYERKFGG